VAVAVVGNRWADLPGNLSRFRVWFQPSETKEMSIMDHIALLPFSKDISLLRYVIHILHSTNLFQK
jgi:hypothetical protein